MSHGSTDRAAAQKALEKISHGGWWKPKEGKNRFRLLPPWSAEAGQSWFEWHLHWNVGPKNMVVPCIAKMHGEPCYLCEQIARDPSLGDKTFGANSMVVRHSVAYNILDLEVPELGPQVYTSGPQVFEGLLNYICDDQWGAIDDPDSGFNLTLDKNKNRNPVYDVKADRQPCAVEPRSVLNELHNLSEVFTMHSYEDQQAIFEGRDVDKVNGTPESVLTESAPIKSVQQEEPAPVPTTTPAPVTAGKTKPRCFGSFDKDDTVCPGCSHGKSCLGGIS